MLGVLGDSNGSLGRKLNREAVRRLELAHDHGFTHTELAELYETLKLQIEAACPGWRADRVECADGSHAFVGALGLALVITQDRGIYVGRLGKTALEGVLFYTGAVITANGHVAFPPPNPNSPGTRTVR